MAILKNLLVTGGASRFLGHIYCQDISVSGTATLSSLSLSGNLSVTGTSTMSGNTTVGGTLGVTGAATFNNWITTANNYGWKSAHGGGWYMTDNNYVRSYGKPVMMGHNLYFNSTSYYVNTSGAASFSSIASPSATISNATISGDLTVNGVLQANDFIKNIVKAVGGQLYVSPTFQATDSTTVTCTAVTATQLSLTLSDNAINGTDYAGATWYKDSKVMLSGTLTANTTGHTEEIIFSSVPGVVTANMSSSNKLQIKLDYDGASTYFKTGTLTTSDVAVMMYQINIPSGSTNAGLHPIGIYIKAYGTDNKNSYIDIFGGTSNTPNARLGLLNGLSAMQNGTTPSGWGIATTNGFFDGTIVSSSGKIGAFTLSSDLRSGTWGTSGSVLVAGGYTPTTADAKSIGGSPTTGNTWAFTAGNAFGVTTAGKIYASDAEISGKITATSGAIAGWRIESTYIASGTATAPAANVLLLSPAGTSSSYTVAGTAKSGWMITAGTTFGVNKDGGVYATSGKIGGWTIGTSSLYNTTNSMTSTGVGLYLGTDGIRNYASGTQYVNITGGKITALGVDVSGKITATSGAIGGFDITSTAIKTKDVAVTSNVDNSISLSSADFTRTINSTSRAGLRFAIGDKFGVTGDGIIYASSAHISGTLNAGANSTIGPWTVTATSIYKGSNTLGTANAAYFGNSGLSVGSKFRVDASGVATLGDPSGYHATMDTDSFDVLNGSTTLATFGTESVIGNMSSRGVSINDKGFKFNNGGIPAFYVGVDYRDGLMLFLSNNYSVSSSSTTATIDGKVYYYICQVASDRNVLQVGNSIVLTSDDDEVLGAADSYNYSDWVVSSAKLYISKAEIDSTGSSSFVRYIYSKDGYDVADPYCVIGKSVYSTSNPAGNMSLSQGYGCTAGGAYSTSVGWQNISSGTASVSCGNQSKAQSDYSFAGGFMSTASGDSSFAYGYKTIASGERSIAMGTNSAASGDCSTAFGASTRATGDYSSAFGFSTRASAIYSSAFGVGSTASGTGSTAFGTYNTASEWAAVAFGNNTTASGNYSSAFGYYTTASGIGSTAFDSNTIASGNYSSAFGYYTTASSTDCATFGRYTKATQQHQFVIGVYNEEDTIDNSKSHSDGYYGHYAFIIGNGEDDSARSNAFTVDWAGNVEANKFIGKQKVLWDKGSSGWYMSADQDIPLSEAVSKQSTGIVLVWSRYNPSTSTTYDDNFYIQFVPKWFVANQAGKGETFLLADHAFGGPMATKYVYVYDTHIKGNANNTKTGTGQGVTYANNRYVLRLVIGV